MISEPEPTDVMPTTSPPIAPIAMVGSARTSITGGPIGSACPPTVAMLGPFGLGADGRARTARSPRRSRRAPSALWRNTSIPALRPRAFATERPRKRPEPTRRRAIARGPCAQCGCGDERPTRPSFITALATRSLETAASGDTRRTAPASASSTHRRPCRSDPRRCQHLAPRLPASSPPVALPGVSSLSLPEPTEMIGLAGYLISATRRLDARSFSQILDLSLWKRRQVQDHQDFYHWSSFRLRVTHQEQQVDGEREGEREE